MEVSKPTSTTTNSSTQTGDPPFPISTKNSSPEMQRSRKTKKSHVNAPVENENTVEGQEPEAEKDTPADDDHGRHIQKKVDNHVKLGTSF